MPGADDTGELADGGIAADILREAGGEPEAAESDRAEETEGQEPRAARRTPKPKAQSSRTSTEPAADDETADELETEQPEGETPEGEDEEQPEGEQPQGDDEQPEGEQPEGEQPAGHVEDETPEWAKRRFGEYARKVERLEQQLAAANARLSGGNQPAARPSPAELDVLAAETPDQLAEIRAQAERLEEWAELHQAGVEADPENPQSRAYSAQEIAQVRISARRRLRAVEDRARQLEHTQRFNASAAQLYPGFTDPDSDESRAASMILQQVPELRRLPNYRIIIGDALAGERARQKQAGDTEARRSPSGKPLPGKPAAAAAGAVRKAPPVSSAPARGSAAPAGKFALRQKARSRAFQSGSEADIARFVEASLG